MKDFFTYVFGEGVGLACVTRTDPLTGEPSRDKFFEYPAQLQEMVEHCTRFSHESIYFVPTLFSEAKRRKSVAVYGEMAFGDADLFPVADLRVPPSMIVQTSAEKTHVYWKIEGETNPLELERLSHAVSNAHNKAETDYDKGWSSAKLLRVPGTTHLKDPSNPYKVSYEITSEVYTVAEFAEKYPLPVAGAVIDSKLPDNIPTREQAIESIRWTQEIQDILTGEYRKGEDKRYKVLHLAQHELFRAGATNEATFAILVDSVWNKWASDGVSDSSQRLWEDIQRARAQSEVVGADEAAPLAVSAPKEDRYKRVDFLTPEERASLKPTFVDEFVAWGQSKTKTSPAFHVAAGFTILSAVFADFAHIKLEWKEPLNLWFMPTGQTTKDHKTTVMNQMLSVLSDLDREDLYDYKLGSDFTVNALSDILLDQPYRSGVVYVDEFQGFLYELGKNYMAGTKESLTAMYSGEIKGKMRSTAAVKRRKSVPYALSFFAMGITKQIAGALDREDFLSGFLTRFIYVQPAMDWEPPHILEGFTLPSEERDRVSTHEYNRLVSVIRNAREWWEDFVDPTLPTEPIVISRGAHDRMSVFHNDMNLNVIESGKEELESTIFRMGQSVYKCAALIAMSECSESIEVEHVLAAINFAGDWYLNILRMVDLISESDWVKVQDEIVATLIGAGSALDSRKLYAKFKDSHKPREYAEILKALVDAGEIQMIPENKKVMVRYVGGDID